MQDRWSDNQGWLHRPALVVFRWVTEERVALAVSVLPLVHRVIARPMVLVVEAVVEEERDRWQAAVVAAGLAAP
jgi:hypothetical protein